MKVFEHFGKIMIDPGHGETKESLNDKFKTNIHGNSSGEKINRHNYKQEVLNKIQEQKEAEDVSKKLIIVMKLGAIHMINKLIRYMGLEKEG